MQSVATVRVEFVLSDVSWELWSRYEALMTEFSILSVCYLHSIFVSPSIHLIFHSGVVHEVALYGFFLGGWGGGVGWD